jgi:hypothetical protein
MSNLKTSTSKSNVQVVAKLTTEERFKTILSRPRNPHARIRLAMPKTTPKLQEFNK